VSPITVAVEVQRRAEQVFAYATDASRFKEWQEGVVDGHIDSADGCNAATTPTTTRRAV
jgi:hypothetical protein